MSRDKDAVLYLVIGAQRIEWGLSVNRQWLPDSFAEVGLDVQEATQASLDALYASLPRVGEDVARWLAAHVGAVGLNVQSVRVLVAESWLAAASVPWCPAMRGADSAQDFSRNQLTEAGFQLEPDTRLRLGEAPYGQARLALAYPAELLEILGALAAAFGARLASVLALSIAAWTLIGRGRAPVLAIRDRGMLAFARGGAHLQDLSIAAMSGGVDDRQALHTQWQRLKLRDPNLSGQAVLYLCDLSDTAVLPAAGIQPLTWPDSTGSESVPAGLRLARLAASHRLAHDAVQSRPALTWSQWLILASAAMLACAMMAGAARTAWQVRSVGAQVAAAVPATQSRPRHTGWSSEEAARVQAVNVAVRQLNVPIAALFKALRPPRDIRVAILSLDLADTVGQAGGPAHAKITAEALSGADMVSYVTYVAHQPPFVGAYLTRHEVVEAQPEQPYRFTLEATWAD